MMKNLLTFALVVTALLGASLACSNSGGNGSPAENRSTEASNSSAAPKAGPPAEPSRLESYAIKGIKFAYYKIPANLKQDELIAVAQTLHEREPDTQIIMVDDDSELADYIHYVKAISGIGELEKPLPKDWADKHVIANIQKYTSGKFVLCEGTGSVEIAELK